MGSAEAPEDDAAVDRVPKTSAERMARAERQRSRVRPGRLSAYGFVIAGVQKAGTTSLYAMLSEHPQIAPASSKELHFFDDDKIDWDRAPYHKYQRQIRVRETAKIAGEATPRYIFWPGAMERIREYNPGILIILSFRDPIERAFSHWSMSLTRETWSQEFSETIRRGSKFPWPQPASTYRANTARTIVSRGYYGAQLDHVLELFTREQVLLLDYHRVFRELDVTLASVANFLGVDPFPPDVGGTRLNTASSELVGNPPTPDDIVRLAEVYADDLERFAARSDLDVAAWPTARVINGTLDPAEFAAALGAKVRPRAHAAGE